MSKSKRSSECRTGGGRVNPAPTYEVVQLLFEIGHEGVRRRRVEMQEMIIELQSEFISNTFQQFAHGRCFIYRHNRSLKSK